MRKGENKKGNEETKTFTEQSFIQKIPVKTAIYEIRYVNSIKKGARYCTNLYK